MKEVPMGLLSQLSAGAHALEGLYEHIQFFGGGIDVGGDAAALYALTIYGDGPDTVFFEQRFCHFAWFHISDADIGNSAGAGRIGGRIEYNIGQVLHPAGPVLLDVAQARLLAVEAQGVEVF